MADVSYEYSLERVIRNSKKKRIRFSFFQTLGLIAFSAFSLIFLYPLIWLADASFRPKIEMFNIPPKFLDFSNGWPHFGSYSLTNFINALLAPHGINLGGAFINSIIVTAGTTVLTLLLCSLCAYAFAFLRFPLKNLFFYFILLSFMLPTITMLSPYYKLMIALRLRNNLLGLILPGSVSAIGVFLMRQFYIKLPYSFIESAKIDGASHLKIWWNIILPLSTPALAALFYFHFQKRLERFPHSDHHAGQLQSLYDTDSDSRFEFQQRRKGSRAYNGDRFHVLPHTYLYFPGLPEIFHRGPFRRHKKVSPSSRF